jgi:MinD-like ATPase involved in chromosome partitioning or flagellar assembly
MIAADRSVVVFSPDTFALAGYNHLLLIIGDISEMLGKNVKIDMALLNRWPLSGNRNETFRDKIFKFFGNKKEDEVDGNQEIRDLLEKRVRVEIPEIVTVPEGVHISQSIKQGVPLVVLSPDDPSLQGFREAARIIDQWR